MALPLNENENWRGPCEAGVAVNDEWSQPLVRHCGQPGRWFKGGFAFGLVLCPAHEDLVDRVRELEMYVHDLRAKKRGRAADNRLAPGERHIPD